MRQATPASGGNDQPVLTATYAIGREGSVPSARAITRIFPLGDEDERILLGVSDGIGDGAAAEAEAAEALARLEATAARAAPDAGAEAVLRSAYAAAAEAIGRLNALPGSVASSGAALVAALVHGGTATVANLGRGAAYLLRGGVIRRITADHRWGPGTAAERTADPDTTPELATQMPLGTGGDAAPDVAPALVLQPGDTLLLCSESVARQLGARVINAVLDEYGAGQAAQELSDLASRQAGVSGAAVALLHYPLPAAAALPPIVPGRRRPRWLVAGVLAGAIAAGALLAGGIYYAVGRGANQAKPAASPAARLPAASPTPALPPVLVPVSPSPGPSTPARTATPLPRTSTPAAAPAPIVVASLPACDASGSQRPCRYTAQPGDSVSLIGDKFNLTRACFEAANRQHQPVPPRAPEFRIGLGEDYAILGPADCAALLAATPAAGAAAVASSVAATLAASPVAACTPRPGASAPNPLC